MKEDRRKNFAKKGGFALQFRWKEVAKEKPVRHYPRAMKKMLAEFLNNGNINKQKIGRAHVRCLLILILRNGTNELFRPDCLGNNLIKHLKLLRRTKQG